MKSERCLATDHCVKNWTLGKRDTIVPRVHSVLLGPSVLPRQERRQERGRVVRRPPPQGGRGGSREGRGPHEVGGGEVGARGVDPGGGGRLGGGRRGERVRHKAGRGDLGQHHRQSADGAGAELTDTLQNLVQEGLL